MPETFDLSRILANLDAKIAARNSGDQQDQVPPSFQDPETIDAVPELDKSGIHVGAVVAEPNKVPTEIELETRKFIEANQQTVAEVLTKLVKDKKVVMVGESHGSDCEQLRVDVKNALPALKKEGLTHIALETDSKYQEIIDSMDYGEDYKDIIKQLRGQGVGDGWRNSTFEIFIMAKLIGIKVVLIDYHDRVAEQTQEYSQTENIRDAHMASTIMDNVDAASKVLVYIGSNHVERIDGASVKRLRAHLSDAYGDENVGSVRNVGQDDSFNCTYLGPRPNTIYGERKGGEAVMVPDAGPLRGNRNTDYINFIT